MAESNSPPAIPDKSRSLRKTSVKKRLETEVKRKEPKSMKDRLSKKARLSKYRRKSANAKERERMKRQNDVFEVLKEILPCDKAKRSDEEKETKVTTLRSAIAYINSLQSLLDDCEAGRLDSSLVRHCSLTSATTPTSRKKKRSPGGKRKTGQAGLKEKMEPKWTHYSKQDLRTKFEPKIGVVEASGATTTIGLLPASSVPPFTLATPSSSPPAQATSTTSATYQLPTTIFCEAPPLQAAQAQQQGANLPDYCCTNSSVDASSPTVFCASSPTTGAAPNSGAATLYQCTTSQPTTYLCPAPTILVTTNNSNNIEPMVEPSSSSPSYIYATTSSPNLIYTEGEMVASSPNSSCSFYSPVPSSPRDVNEISLHISLLDTR